MGRKPLRDHKGLTLFELLAVIVILVILAAVAVPVMGSVIQESRNRAFISNAYIMKEAASMYTRAQMEAMEVGERQVLYDELVTEGYLEPFKDPDTQSMMQSGNGSFVKIVRMNDGTVNYYIYLNGQLRHIGDSGIPIAINGLTNNEIVPN